MKIHASFAMPHALQAKNIGRFLLTLSSLLLLLSLWLLMDVVRLNEELEHSSRHIKVLKSESESSNVDLPSMVELKRVSAEVEQMNGLAQGYPGNISKVLYGLEQIIPERGHLVSLSYKQGSSELTVTATASESDVLASFAKQLEEQSAIAEVIYAKQLRGQKKGDGSSVEIRLRLSR